MSEDSIRTAVYAELLDTARRDTLRLAESVPPDRRLHQIQPEKATPLWLVGHLANTVNHLMLCWTLGLDSMLPGDFGPRFAPHFAGGAPPSTDPEAYPPWNEVLARYDDVMRAAVDATRALPDSALAEGSRGAMPEIFRGRFDTIASVVARMISHDAHHRGQIGLIAGLG